MRKVRLLYMLLLLCCVAQDSFASQIIPDRRRPQFQYEPGYIVLPFVYDYPGIGKGYGLFGAAANIGGTSADVAGSVFAGDVLGEAAGMDAIPVVRERLLLDIGVVNLSTVTLQNYSQRGMATEKNDYTLIEFGRSRFGGGRLTATFADRRYEAFVGIYAGAAQIERIRDRDGGIIIEAQDGGKDRQHTRVFGARVDLTDDYQDPRRGIRAEASRWDSPSTQLGPDFFTVDYNVTAYVPLGRRSTWAFNYFRSDAHVLRQGETNRAAIEAQTGLDCASLLDAELQQQCFQVIDATIAHNTYGTASALGGLSRLRSYPLGRYTGAHTEFAGSEIRWNLTDEATPFNIVVMKDIRTSMQVALFYEIGTIADRRSELWDIARSSYGAGFRVVTASGLVYRIDIAAGREGVQPSIFFQYPWEM